MIDLSVLVTESRNKETMGLDQMTPLEIVTVMNREDGKAVEAVGEVLPQIAQAICRLPRYLTKPRQRRSEWDMAGSDGISRVSTVFRGKSLLTNKMRII